MRSTTSINLRTYGSAPFNVAVVHGGPGARGELAPVAMVLSQQAGVLEPLQKATSVEQQIEELKTLLQQYGEIPINLIGHSWGAWLSFILASRHPDLVRKLVLVGAGPFEDAYAAKLTELRLNRLSEAERIEARGLLESLNDPKARDKASLFARLGQLMSKADSFDAFADQGSGIELQVDTYQRVWNEAKELRRNGELLRMGEKIRCPVLAIHGDYDPHPVDGVRLPLSRVLENFHLEVLNNCGHYPWLERQARDRFYEILRQELI